MALGTAKITEANGTLTLRFTTLGNFLLGEQTFGNGRQGWNAALRFCRLRGLRVI